MYIFSIKTKQRLQDFLLLSEMALSLILLLAGISIYLPLREKKNTQLVKRGGGGGGGWYTFYRQGKKLSFQFICVPFNICTWCTVHFRFDL